MDPVSFFVVLNVGFIATIVDVLHMIIAFAKTPPGQVYLFTGHYYLDYFEYLESLSQGWHGHWVLSNYYGTDIKFQTFFGQWQYIIFGQIGHFFGFSQIDSYWLTMICLSVIFSITTFFLIKKLLHNKPFVWQLAAYILALFAAPFFKIIQFNGHLATLSYRFWNDKAVLIDRIEGIPYHLTDQILTMISIMIIADCLDRLNSLTKKSLMMRTLLVVFLMTFVLTFSPAYFLLAVGALSLTLFWTFFYKKSLKKIKFLGMVVLILFPIGVLVRNYMSHQFFYTIVLGIESAWQIHPDFLTVVLTTGPILLFAWLGIKNYFRNLTPIRLIFFNLVFISYLLFFLPIAPLLGTTNTRFLLPLDYVFFAVLTVIGLKKMRSLVIVFAIVFLLFIPGNIEAIIGQTINMNLVSPISYMPKGIIDGFKFLKKYPGHGGVLTTPAQFLGTIVPIYADKPVYLERPGQTQYDEKVALSARFYWAQMDDKTGRSFLKDNQIEFVVLTSIENYPLQPLTSYKFLRKIYQNKDIVIFQKI